MKERIWRRLIAVALAVVLAVGLGFGLKFAVERLARDPGERALAEVELLPHNATDVAQLTVGIPEDTELFSVDGQGVTAEEYLYWLGNLTSSYEMMYSYSGEALDFAQEAAPGVTWDEQIKEIAYQNAALLALTPKLAEEQGVKLSAEEVQELIEGRESDIANVGGTAQYAFRLQAMGISDATVLRMDQRMTLFTKVQKKCLDTLSAALSAAEVQDYVEENDLLRAKHILLLTKDMATGEAYDEETRAQQRAKAEELLEQLRAKPERFDTLMNENSEDSGLKANPDGYVFTTGQMVAPFEEGTRALAVGEISEIVESEYGYHIILRLDPDCEQVRQALAATKFEEEIDGRVANAEVVKSEAYDTISTAEYYEKLVDFQGTLAQPEIQDQSKAELATP